MHKYAKRNGASATVSTPSAKIPVAVAGARGYAGLELLRVLLKHPHVEVQACFANEAVFTLSDYLPEAAAAQVSVLPMSQFKETAARVKAVFLATPAEVSSELALVAMSQGADVIDLSGAFRLGAEEARTWYGLKHEGPALQALANASYGLVPWVGPAQGTEPRLVANPGCYATAILMAILPLLKAGLIEPASLVIDAKSGASGAGRKAAENLLFCEVEGECLPYKVGAHQHLPEIQKCVHDLLGVHVDPMLSTHLLPIRRGIQAGIYARVRPGVQTAQIEQAYAAAYSSYALARTGPLSAQPKQALSLKRIAGSARTEICFELKGDKLYVFSLIDNLLKGAASQAVENFNRLVDLPVTTALNELEGVL